MSSSSFQLSERPIVVLLLIKYVWIKKKHFVTGKKTLKAETLSDSQICGCVIHWNGC